MPRAEFSRTTQARMFARADGRCEGMVDIETGRYAAARGDDAPNLRRCGNKIGHGHRRWIADHIIPDAIKTDLNTEENGQCLCDLCDREKTARDQGMIAKCRRLADRQAGIRKPGSFLTNRDGPYRAKLRGGLEKR